MMVGRKLDEMFPHVPHSPTEPILSLEKLCGDPLPTDVDLELRRGEILGIAGLVGAGRTELLRTIFGLSPVHSGKIRVQLIGGRGSGIHQDQGALPSTRIRQNVGLLSEDRKEEGLALPMTIADNMTLSRLDKVGWWGFLNLNRQRSSTRRWISRLELRCEDPDQAVWNLSGGNQQKVAIARLLHQDADVLLLDEPTRGIDVGAKVQVFQLMGELAASGKAILFVSSYLPELMGVSDRIGVMSRGQLVDVRSTTEWTEHTIMLAATGSDNDEDQASQGARQETSSV